jgi:hypothetical protein
MRGPLAAVATSGDASYRLYVQVPESDSDLKRYVISLVLGPDRHDLEVLQEPPR